MGTACPLHSTAVPSSKDHPPPLLLEALQKRNALDVQLYASARASFERALAKLPQEAAPEPMFVHVHGAGTGGQDSKKNSKGNGDQTDADAEKADDGNDAGEAPPRASARQKALLTAQWLTAQEADASSPDDANPLAGADESDETGDPSLRGAAEV